MSNRYEWDVEVYTDDEYQDIEDHLFQSDYAGCVKEMQAETPEGMKKRVVLVRDDDSRNGGRSWAYMENGKLPEYFEDAYGVKTAKVPKRFHQEVSNE